MPAFSSSRHCCWPGTASHLRFSVSLCPAVLAGAGDFPRDALFGNQSIMCAPAIHISNSPSQSRIPCPWERAVRQIPSTASHSHAPGPGTARGHATRGMMRHRGSHYLRGTRYGGHKRCPHHHAACDGEGGAAQSISTPGARIAPSDGDAPHRGFCCHFGISWTFGSWDECRAPQGCLVCWAGCKMPESDLAGLDSLTCVWESNATTSECDVVARPYRFRRFNPTDVVGVVVVVMLLRHTPWRLTTAST